LIALTKGTPPDENMSPQPGGHMTRKMTMAQAIIGYLKQQHVERDGKEHSFFAGCCGIF